MQGTTKGRYIHMILLMQDEVGQIKTVMDGKLTSVNVDRKPDGTGHIYGEFASEISREAIQKLIEAKKQAEEEKVVEKEEPSGPNGSSKKKATSAKKKAAKKEPTTEA